MDDRPMSTRLDNIDRYVTETNQTYSGPYQVARKYMCDTRRVLQANVHSFRSRGRQYRFERTAPVLPALQDAQPAPRHARSL